MRALILLLAILLPMQLSWAAVASYCQAKSDRGAAHLGHHEHPSAEAEEHAASQQSKAGDGDLDCSLCHFCAMKSVQAGSALAVAPPTARQQSHFHRLSHPASHIADGPDKPNWLLAA